MPKVTEAHRDARRLQIAQAAISCMTRRGVSNTSMADIIAESGLSAGAIYSNFENKAELARFVATTVIDLRTLQIETTLGTDGRPPTPRQLIAATLRMLSGEVVPIAVVVQVWAEATVDESMRAAVDEVIVRLRGTFQRGIAGWARERYPDAGEADAASARLARVMVAFCQGFIVDAALFGHLEPEEYLATVSEALA